MELRPGYKRTEVGVIPEEWGIATLGDSATTYSGGTPPTDHPEYYGDEIPWITSSDLNRIFISEVHGGITKAGLANSAAKMVPAGSILFALYGATAGVTAMTNIEAAINQAVLAVIPNKALAEFLFYFLRFRKDNIVGTYTQGGQPNLSGEIVRGLPIPLPNEAEQRAIATALSDVDALLTQLDLLIAKKRDIKQAAMQQLLTGKTRLPRFGGAWRSGTVGDVVEALEAGVSVNSMDDPPTPGAPSVLKTSAVSAGRFLPEGCKRITAADIPRARINPLASTILISRMNTPDLVGEVAYVPVDYPWLFLPDRLWMTRLKPGTRIDARWLAYLLSSRAYQQQIKAAATGTSGSMKNISKDSLLGIPVLFPEHEEQTAIATLLSDLDAELAALEARRDKTRALKQGMMQELLTGRTRLA